MVESSVLNLKKKLQFVSTDLSQRLAEPFSVNLNTIVGFDILL